jgi:hypothetical protein
MGRGEMFVFSVTSVSLYFNVLRLGRASYFVVH